MSEKILTPAQERAVKSVLDKCNRCRPILEFLRNVGIPQEEEEQRLEHLQNMANTAIELNNQPR